MKTKEQNYPSLKFLKVLMSSVGLWIADSKKFQIFLDINQYCTMFVTFFAVLIASSNFVVSLENAQVSFVLHLLKQKSSLFVKEGLTNIFVLKSCLILPVARLFGLHCNSCFYRCHASCSVYEKEKSYDSTDTILQ